MKMAVVMLGVLALLVACEWSTPGTGSSAPPPERDRVVVDSFETIKDGHTMAYKLEPGIYRLEMTASAGAGVEWIGATCTGSRETKNFSGLCELQSTGQLVISNPPGFLIGSDTSVTIKVTRIARSSSAAQ